jgi:asparagine synthase (glutamine-hydrolysing)
MCGIYGFVGQDLGAPDHAGALLGAMDRALFHRGPDDGGAYFDGRCAMGMRRLSIIDLAAGHQPLGNEDGSVWVVFNGEIYNYRELHAQLSARGHQLATRSDTECLVHLYEDRGADLVHALDGMFAFALWDRARGELTLARDRLGIKPLYYAELEGGLLFGSELKSLLQHPALQRRISPRALSHYFAFGVTPDDEAIVDGVRKLPPGHVLSWRAGRIAARRYWDLRPPARGPFDEGDAIDEVRFLVRQAVRTHLVADVPVGAFLSGGIDSASVVAHMALLGARPKTFSIGFDDPRYDELAWARVVAQRFGTDHHELVVRPDAWALAEELAFSLDEPFADVSAVPTFLVSKLASSEVKVVLTGDGGDEVFAGYDRYPKALAEAARYDRLPARLRQLVGSVASLLPAGAPGKHRLHHLAMDPTRRFIDGQSLFPHHQRPLLRGSAPVARAMSAEPSPLDERAGLYQSAPGDALSRLLYLDTMTYLPLDILTKVDRMTMACSLEARPPLLDHHLVEALFAMPSSLKLRENRQKHVFKRAMAGLVPQEILTRGKFGFGVPIERWFRGPLRAPVEELLADRRTRARGLWEPRFASRLCSEHARGRRDHSLQLWALVMLELWCRRFLDEPAPNPAREGDLSWATPSPFSTSSTV